jgi:hypothetical protein
VRCEGGLRVCVRASECDACMRVARGQLVKAYSYWNVLQGVRASERE